MGKKGGRLTGEATAVAEALVETLAPIGDVSQRKMFGGLGIFENGAMFAIVDSGGGVFLKADDQNVARFVEAGSTRHGKMPYYSIPTDVSNDGDALRTWAEASVAAAHRGKKGK